MALARTFIPIEVDRCKRVRFYNNSANTLSEGDGFNIQAGTVTALANNNTYGIFGVCIADVAASAYGECWVQGTFKVAVSGTLDFAQGEAVYTAGATSVDKGSKNDVPIGHVVHENPASGAASIYIEICSQAFDRTVHA